MYNIVKYTLKEVRGMANIENKMQFINDKNSIIQKFLNNSENIKIEFYLLRKLNNKDKLYESMELILKDDVIEFLRKTLCNNLNELLNDNEFSISSYNDEFHINDSLANIDLNENDKLKSNFTKMKKSLSEKELTLKNAKFQSIKLIDKSTKKCCYVFYYQGINKMSAKKKVGFISSDDYHLMNKDLIKIGGFLDFIIDEKEVLYIHSPRPFEWAFNYEDHINKKRDENINTMLEKNIFNDEDSKQIFKEEASKYLRSRAMATIDEGLMSELESHFNNRIAELKILKENSNENLGIVSDLFEFIDFNESKIFINENNKKNLNAVFILLQNKIVTSFLTKEFKTAIGYVEKGD